MSDSILVMLEKEKMPTAKEWAEQIQKEGFGFELDTSWSEEDGDEDLGYRQCKYYDLDEVGFELSMYSREDEPEDFEKWEEKYYEVKKCDLAVTFGVYEENDVYAAMVAGGVLAKISNGIYFNVDEPMDIEELYQSIRKIDDEMKLKN